MAGHQKAVEEIAELGRALSEQGDMEDRRLINELIEAAHELGVPTRARRDDASVFLAGTEKIETATWTQCGGLLFSVAHDELAEAPRIAAKVAHRIAALLPARLAHRI